MKTAIQICLAGCLAGSQQYCLPIPMENMGVILPFYKDTYQFMNLKFLPSVVIYHLYLCHNIQPIKTAITTVCMQVKTVTAV